MDIGIAEVLQEEGVNLEEQVFRKKGKLTMRDYHKIMKIERTIEYIGKKKWAEALKKEKEEEGKQEARVAQTKERKTKETERLAWLCRNREDINEFVKIAFAQGTLPSIINGHDCILKICEMIYEDRNEEYWVAKFDEQAAGRINEIIDMSKWFMY